MGCVAPALYAFHTSVRPPGRNPVVEAWRPPPTRADGSVTETTPFAKKTLEMPLGIFLYYVFFDILNFSLGLEILIWDIY